VPDRSARGAPVRPIGEFGWAGKARGVRQGCRRRRQAATPRLRHRERAPRERKPSRRCGGCHGRPRGPVWKYDEHLDREQRERLCWRSWRPDRRYPKPTRTARPSTRRGEGLRSPEERGSRQRCRPAIYFSFVAPGRARPRFARGRAGRGNASAAGSTSASGTGAGTLAVSRQRQIPPSRHSFARGAAGRRAAAGPRRGALPPRETVQLAALRAGGRQLPQTWERHRLARQFSSPVPRADRRRLAAAGCTASLCASHRASATGGGISRRLSSARRAARSSEFPSAPSAPQSRAGTRRAIP
jgi:hypothetical protein